MGIRPTRRTTAATPTRIRPTIRPPPTAYAPPPGYAEPQGATTGNDTALAQRFASANTSHDGRLTQRQAEAANWLVVAGNFPQIDIDQKGYVTLPEIRAWLAAQAPPPPGLPG